jgi:WD40 repeat protein
VGLTFSPDGKILVTAGSDHAVRLWNVGTRQQIGEPIIASASDGNTVAFSPDGRILATGSYDKSVKLWDVGTRRQVGRTLTSDAMFPDLVFSPDGKTLAVVAAETVRLWDVAKLMST